MENKCIYSDCIFAVCSDDHIPPRCGSCRSESIDVANGVKDYARHGKQLDRGDEKKNGKSILQKR